MKKNLLIFLTVIIALITVSSTSYAAFPITSNNFIVNNSTNTTTVTKQTREENSILSSVSAKDEGNYAHSSGKNQWIALILFIVLGALAAHRWYLGYYGSAVLFILTLGGFGIWALIDLIRLIIGDLKPKHGNYSVKI